MLDADEFSETPLIYHEEIDKTSRDVRQRYPTPTSPARREHSHKSLVAASSFTSVPLEDSKGSKPAHDLSTNGPATALGASIDQEKSQTRATGRSLSPPENALGLSQSRTIDNTIEDERKPQLIRVVNEHKHGSENHKRKQSQVDTTDSETVGKEKIAKLSSEKMYALISDPASLPSLVAQEPVKDITFMKLDHSPNTPNGVLRGEPDEKADSGLSIDTSNEALNPPTSTVLANNTAALRPATLHRALSTPLTARAQQNPQKAVISKASTFKKPRDNAGTLHIDNFPQTLKPSPISPSLASPLPASIPLPPLSIHTYLQLELSSHRPSPLYIHRSTTNDFPYESSKVKIERLLNFMWLYPQLESVLWFGTLACFDSWLYTFTILPLRLVRSIYLLSQSWVTNLVGEMHFVFGFIYSGTGRMWRRRRTRGGSIASPMPGSSSAPPDQASHSSEALNKPRSSRHHKRAKSVPSTLLPDDKADILKGLLIICTCIILLRLDASKMYHWIRGQAAIKLYVIYNVLEVCDRLFSAIGQDILECLFSREALERKPDGHSKILRPLWLFALALLYTVVHATSLFYQVITLNVAVNSYSNALITLLISNQFVEIKSTVFKKFEKENLFQLTCADVVERFQLWLMLTIIASRNIVETGGLSVGLSMPTFATSGAASASPPSASNPLTQAMPPRSSTSILPSSFTLLPALVSSLTAYAPAVGHVLGPFLVVLGSEMFVDWLKHAYIGKFNNTRPTMYGRFLDVLAKDYYTNAFGDQNLTKRLGLPVIPLSCLFIRAGVQTYHMFVTSWLPSPLPSAATGLSSVHAHYATSRASQPTSTTAAISQRFDDLLRQMPAALTSSTAYRHFNTILVFALGFLVLLAVKLVLGILLLSFSRSRYRSMKERERQPVHHVDGGRRIGGWGVVEVDSDKRRWIYDDDAAGLQALRDREERDKAKRDKGVGDIFDKVKRYEMVAKRIW